MAERLSPQEIFRTTQDEALKLFDVAIQGACKKIDNIANEARYRMESLLRDLEEGKLNLIKQLGVIQEQTVDLINKLVKETETYILNLWEDARQKIVMVVDTIVAIVDKEKINSKIDELTNFMLKKISEFNQRVKEHADEIIKLQQSYFSTLTQNLEAQTSQK